MSDNCPYCKSEFFYCSKLEKIKEIVTKYSQHEGYLLDDLFTDLVDELSEVLKDE